VTESPLLDPAVWESLRSLDDDPAFLDELIDLFIDDAMPRAERVRTALAVGDLAAARAAAHSIRGTAGNIGATRVAAMATDIEHDLEAGVSVTADRADHLHTALQHVVTELQARRSTPRPPARG
jgi:HPt (histidine-containing phosphotransfer) domain-containing protein